MREVVRSESRGSTRLVLVDRPDTRNAVDLAVCDALRAAIDRIEGDSSARAIVLAGAGGTFVSGGDLKLIRATPFDETLRLCERMGDLLDRLERLPLPVIAAIEGAAFGGGLEIALACDYRIAGTAARLSFRQAAMGVTTGWGATTRLARLVARSTATRLLLWAEVLEPTEALSLGLVDEVAGSPLQRAIELGAGLDAVSPRAVAGFKRTLAAAYAPDALAREREADVFRELWGAPDHREALEAFFERRPARWG